MQSRSGGSFTKNSRFRNGALVQRLSSGPLSWFCKEVRSTQRMYPAGVRPVSSASAASWLYNSIGKVTVTCLFSLAVFIQYPPKINLND